MLLTYKYILVPAGLLCVYGRLFAQTPQQVIAGCGAGSTAINGYTIDFTLGEAVTATGGSTVVFTQGFLQPPAAAGAYALPYVTLTAQAKDNYILAAWTSNAEVDNRLFYVQRSADSLAFTTIDSVFSNAPGGNSNTPLSYRYADLQPLAGKNYYRLQLSGKQGNTGYSNIAMAHLSHSRWSIHLYPNPFQNMLKLKLFTDVNTVCVFRIINAAGQQVIIPRYASFVQGYNDYSLNLSFLPSGFYILHVTDMEQGEQLRIKMIKE